MIYDHDNYNPWRIWIFHPISPDFNVPSLTVILIGRRCFSVVKIWGCCNSNFMKNCVRWSGVKLSLFGLTIVQYWNNSFLLLSPWCETWDIIACSAASAQSCGTLGRNSQRGQQHPPPPLGEYNETTRHDAHQPTLLSIWYRLDTRYRETLTASDWQPGSGLRAGKKINNGLTLGWRDGIYNIYYLPP